MQRKKMFLVVCISALLAGSVKGQNFLPGKGKVIPESLEWRREPFHFSTLPGWDFSGQGKAGRGLVLPDKGIEMGARRGGTIRTAEGVLTTGEVILSGAPPLDMTVIPADRVVTHFGFFCRRELELEKTIRLPLRFRLGSLEYCNRLEGK